MVNKSSTGVRNVAELHASLQGQRRLRMRLVLVGSVPNSYELDQSSDRPDICFGTDAYHTPQALAEALKGMFEDAGFLVALDRPFAGALVSARHYDRDPRVMALMVEVNRGLYMNEVSTARLNTFDETMGRLRDVVRQAILFAMASRH